MLLLIAEKAKENPLAVGRLAGEFDRSLPRQQGVAAQGGG
jgi:hypothetical protein